jgi:glycosyltransferase involved in cell wall biosynthesis
MKSREQSPISGRLDGYRRKIRHEWSMWEHRRLSSANQARYEKWVGNLQKRPPDVFVGVDLPAGGIRGHVRAIREHSSLRVQLVPDEEVMGGYDRFSANIRERFMNFDPSGKPVVHSHVMPWMIRWCRRQQGRGLRWIHTYHLPYFPEHATGDIPDWQNEINEALIHEACHADIRLSVSKWQQKYLDETYGIPTHYLPNGVDVAGCQRGSANRFRRGTGICGPFLLYVGRNDPVKNPGDFVRLARELPKHTFVMIGHDLNSASLARDLQVEAPPNLHLLGGLPYSEVQDAIAACSVLIVTSKREGLPTLVLEAMAHGKPVVVPEEDGCLEAVGHGDFGHVYRPDNLDDLAFNTVSAIEDASKGEAARQRVLAEYDWRVVTPKLDAIYRGSEPH